MPRVTNPILPGGIERYGRSVQDKRRRRWKVKKTTVKPAKVQKPKTKQVPVGGEKNGGKRVVPVHHSPRFVSVDQPKRPIGYKVGRKNRPAKIRQSLTPGTVVIMVAGPFRGKRVVMLKALPSGLLLVSGPMSINGVPLRRVNPAFVIATSTKVDLTGLEVPECVNDEMFKRNVKGKAKKPEFFGDKKNKYGERQIKLPQERVEAQKVVDRFLVTKVKQTPLLKRYLGAKFTLEKNLFPHAIKF
ncbi:ribosomal protein L6 [Salpingoeca rosetta]|uniref:60S ribosomal protein L6 n=1 Tax=Salpingoeca rosetta (strain ATCC 50818 / BSB-021) TaxID=946362 RepID=F2UCD2_SALR5|nr:ribosomal protein L6 [Salpingoeca rosetta]EGD74239.1 ribosomal protein L6 [Salpingoeca rosetta]|eukprot:XP_004993139.1 ribosomal protein L6 [Salpingoeca rosetta]